MKHLLSTITVFILSFTLLFAQADYNKTVYQKKADKYQKMKRNGTFLAVLGGTVTATSLALIATTNWEEQESNNHSNGYYYNTSNTSTTSTSDPKGVLGILGVAIGVPMTTLGVIFKVVGSRKQKEYQRKANNISAGYFQKHGAHGFRLSIKI
jgi:hypothetical protein